MVNAEVNIDQYTADFDRLQKDSRSWLNELRSEGMEKFIDIGFPTARKGNEKWKYTNIAPIARTHFNLARKTTVSLEDVKNAAPWDDSWLNVVFVNGMFMGTFSNEQCDGVQVVSLASEMCRDESGSFVRTHLATLMDYSDDGFAALNTGLMSDGAVITIDDGVNCNSPINLIFFSAGHANTANHPRVLVVAGSGSSSTVIENYVGGGSEASFTNSISEIFVDSHASVDHYRLLMESDDTYDVGYGRVKIKDNGAFTSKSFFGGARLGRYDLNVLIEGEDASCDLKGLYLTSRRQHMDNFINIDHASPNSASRLFYKGILDGHSRAVFGGNVLVRKDAQQTNSVQTDKNLLLSPNAEVDSRPSLFIYADDVKCAHGATAGNIDAETVYYMRSRGLDLETASRLLIYGFAEEIIRSVSVDLLRDYLEREFLSSLPKYKFEF